MLKSFFLPELIWQLIRNNVLIYCFKVVFLKDVRRKILSSIPLRSISLFGFRQIRPSSISDLQASLQLQFPQSWIFLNDFQNLSRFFTVQLSRFFVLSLSATTSILYQMFDRLSTTFLIYFFAFIAIRIDFCRASRVSLVIISCSPTIVNNKFHFFAFSFFNKAIDLFWLLRYAECIFFLSIICKLVYYIEQ